MADDRWAWTTNSTGFQSSGSMGQGTNDSWQIASTFDMSRITQGSAKRLAVLVTGRLCDFAQFGAFPQTGLVEVALGFDSGLKSTTHRHVQGLVRCLNNYPAGTLAGQQFAFLMVQASSPAVTDPDFGATTATNTGTDFVLWARAHWNDDAPTYSATFGIRDIQWLVMDIDVLEGDSLVRASATTDVTLTNNSQTVVTSGATSLGSADEEWLQFSSVYAQPTGWLSGGSLSTVRPLFRTGTNSASSSSTNLTQLVPTAYQGIGQNEPVTLASTRAADLRDCSHALGVRVIDSGNNFPQVLGKDPTAMTSAIGNTIVRRSVLLNIRGDALDAWARNTTISGTEVGLIGTPAAPFIASDKTRLVNASVSFATEPIVLMTSGMDFGGVLNNTQRAHHIRVMSDTGSPVYEPERYTKLLGYERHQSLSIYTTKLIANSTRPHRLQMINEIPGALQTMQFPQLVMFHNTLNVEDVLSPPWTELTPTQITITAEGPLVGTMNTLPVTPDITQSLNVSGVRHGEVLGSQGYRRTWPVWIRPRRQYTLTWSAISATDAATLLDFLDDNDSFALTPPHGVATPVVITGEVQSYRFPDGRKTISIQVSQLLWTA